jgi:hypothetical protein
MRDLAHLTQVATPVQARILAARLGADGIPVQVGGGADGPYPVGPVDLWVLASDVDEARSLLLIDEAEWIVGRAERGEPDPEGWHRAVPPAVLVASPFIVIALVGLLVRVH